MQIEFPCGTTIERVCDGCEGECFCLTCSNRITEIYWEHCKNGLKITTPAGVDDPDVATEGMADAFIKGLHEDNKRRLHKNSSGQPRGAPAKGGGDIESG